jgi:hypothetical protein
MALMATREVISEYIQTRARPDTFCSKPWQASPISPGALRAQVEAAFRQHGYWDTYGEFAMGGGPFVRIERIRTEEQVTYLVTAESVVKISAEYGSYEEGMTALSALAYLVWDLAHTQIVRGHVARPKPLPWPPGPR